ncbi:MAG: hypothetical protein RL318_2533 [Fibrobacterota bacterium]|jgi:hypothetical protein
MRFNLVPVVALSCLTGLITSMFQPDATPSGRPPLSQDHPLPWLPRSTDVLVMTDSALEESLYDWMILRIRAEDSLFDFDREIVMRQPAVYLDLYATRTIEEQLQDGGFAQLLGSVDRRFVHDATLAYLKFGAEEHASLLVRAQGILLDRQSRQIEPEMSSLSSLDEILADADPDTLCQRLDAQWENLEEDLPGLRSAWIHRHVRQFTTP